MRSKRGAAPGPDPNVQRTLKAAEELLQALPKSARDRALSGMVRGIMEGLYKPAMKSGRVRSLLADFQSNVRGERNW